MSNKRLPVYLLIDTSGSMTGAPIQAVNRGVADLIDSLKQDSQAQQTVWLSVITYDKDVKVLLPLTALGSVHSLNIQCPQSGPTHMGEGLRVLNECASREVNSSGDQSPLLFVMTDGKPSDIQVFNEQYPQTLNLGFAKIVGCAAGSKAKPDDLRKFCDPVVTLETMDGASLSSFFQLVSESVTTVPPTPTPEPAPTPTPEPAPTPTPEPAPTPTPTPEPAAAPAATGNVKVIITGCGISTFEAKKVIQECRPDLRSFDLFDLLRNFPKTVVESVPQAEGEAIKKRLEDAGCEIELG